MLRVAAVTGSVAVVGLLVILLARLLYDHWLPMGRSLPGTLVGGWQQPREVELRDWLEQRRDQALGWEVMVLLPEDTVSSTLGALGAELDVDGTARAVLDDADHGSPEARVRRAWQARSELVDLELHWSFDESRAKAMLARLAPLVHREPVDARLDLVGHRRVAEEAGRELDWDRTLSALQDCRERDCAVSVVTRAIPPRVTSTMLTQVDVSKVLSSYETKFGGTGEGRARNIARAALNLSGIVVAPGEALSFNRAVGPRTAEHGFTLAPVIFDDELTPGLGGGVCQVASTLHAASVLGAMEILERHNHSRPSGYIPMGLDATVIYGELDLRIRNPHPFPVMIHAVLDSSARLRIELLGGTPPGKVHYTHWVAERHDFYRRVVTKPWLGSRSLRHQKGGFGYDVQSLVRWAHPDGATETRRYKSEYRPTPEVYWIGPELDASRLPDLPDGATRVELDDRPAEEAGHPRPAEREGA